MVQASNVRRSFHLQLLPIQIEPHQVLNVEIVQHGYGDRAIYQQNMMSLGADVQLPEICDAQDVTIAVLEGNGTLSVNGELVALEPGMVVFIPANTAHRLQTQPLVDNSKQPLTSISKRPLAGISRRSQLIFLLNRCRPDHSAPDYSADETAWIVNL